MAVRSETVTSFDLAQARSERYLKHAQKYVCDRNCGASGNASVLCIRYTNEDIINMYEDGTKCTAPVVPAKRT